MKKNKFILFVTILLLSIMSSAVLTSCIIVGEPEESDKIEIDPGEEEPDAGQQNNDMPDNIQEDDIQSENEYLVFSELTVQEAEDLIDPLTQWAGLYMIGFLDRENELNDTLKLQIAAVTTAYGYLPEISEGSVPADNNDNYLYVSPEELRNAVKWLFGGSADTSLLPLPEETDGFCAGDGEGGALVAAGDWGMEGPRGNIVTIENQDGNLNRVTVSYVLYDYEIGGGVEELGIIEYLVQGTKESGEAPKIIDMIISISRVDQSMYLPENWEETISWESGGYSLTLPGSWFGRMNIYQRDNSDIFAALLCQEENYTGTLFSITTVPAGEEIVFPSYEILGEKDGMTYIALFPTDIEFDPDNESSAAEYNDMYSYVDSVLSTFTFVDN